MTAGASWFPPARWLRTYEPSWLPADALAGVTLAAYAIPVSLAYAALAGLPPEVGAYGYLLGGLGYAALGSSRHLAVGPTSAISLMVGGAVGQMAGDDAVRYGQIATLAGFMVAALCAVAWGLRASTLTSFISKTVLLGFKANLATHPENERTEGILVFRVAGALLYFNAETVQRAVLDRVRAEDRALRLVVYDMSSSPHVDLAGAHLLADLRTDLAARGIRLALAELSRTTHALLLADGVGESLPAEDRRVPVFEAVESAGAGVAVARPA